MNTEFLNCLKQPQERGKSRKKKNRDEPNQAAIHMYLERSEGYSLCSCLKQAKMSFLFSLFCKIREQEGRTGLAWGLTPVGAGRRWRKSGGG
jgi:hypothetical protein